MAKTVVHVNQHVIRRNKKTGEREPALTCKRKSGGPVTRAHQVAIVDEDGREVARVVYAPDAPLKCGAVCWIESALRVIPLEASDL